MNLTEYFDGVKMPEACVRRIMAAMQENKQPADREEYTMKLPKQKRWSIGLAAVCLVLTAAVGILVLHGGNQEESAVTAPSTEIIETLEQIRQAERDAEGLEREQERLRELTEGNAVVCENLELRDGRVYLIYEGREYDITDGIPEDLVLPDATEPARTKEDLPLLPNPEAHTPYTELVDGRVYFTANGEAIDITGLYSTEEPYTYIYTKSKLTYYIAIGGTVEKPGYLEMIYITEPTTGETAFLSGHSVNTWNNQTDARYGWETRAKEIFEPYGVYWAS